LITIIKTSTLKWLGHVNRKEAHREPKTVVQVFLGWEKEGKTKKEVAGLHGR
jgi:hypothetical protein